jgi:TolB-like protein/Tfp pilus assembly protein PilF
MPLSIGTHLGPYEVVGVLGAGGMGEVYRARDNRLGRDVAIKILPESFANDAEAIARFRGEARNLAALNHSNIVGIYDIGVEAGVSFVVFELVEGDTLRRRLSGGPLPPADAINYARQIAEGIGAAHDRGIIHRDLKPENLIVARDSRIKILDFGVAKTQTRSKDTAETMAAVTRPGVIIGTMGYMAPEQLRAQDIDQRVDLFALGVILYEMLTGSRLFRGETDIEVAAGILMKDVQNPATTHPGISPRLGALVCRLVERDPNDRFQSARELIEALDDVGLELNERAGGSISSAGQRQAPKATVAVLPFSDMSAQKDQDYLCDGIAEEIIGALGRATGLRVVARSSAFQFKGGAHDVREVGRKLGATAVLEGSVRKAGNRIRIGVQLANVEGGVQIWSERYDRELEDVLAMQDEIAVNVAEALQARLAPAAANPTPVQTSDLNAYTHYLKARYYWNRRTEADLDQSLHYFREALRRDPSYARAHAGLADALVTLAVYGAKAPADVVPGARASVKRALELDPTLASAHACLGCIESLHDWSWTSAAREFRHAISLGPEEGTAHQAFATNYLVPLGRFDEAASELQIAMALDPLSLAVSSTLGVTLFYAGRYDEAERALLDTLRLDDRFSFAHLFLGHVRAAQARYPEAIGSVERALQLGGRVPEALGALGYALAASGVVEGARGVLEELTSLSQRRYASPTSFAQIHIGLGDRAAALDAIARAAELRAFDLPWLLLRPQFAPLRSEPGFDAIVTAMRLREADEYEARTRASQARSTR